MGARAESHWTSHFAALAKWDSAVAVLQSFVAIQQSNGALVPPESAHHSYIALSPISISSKMPQLGSSGPQCRGGLALAGNILPCRARKDVACLQICEKHTNPLGFTSGQHLSNQGESWIFGSLPF